MKKNSFLVKTVLMSMLTAVSISFASCSDDDDLMTNPYATDDSEVAMTRGGSASDAFKPNVDHSQWMAQLNNSRCWQLTLWGKQLLKGLNAEVNAYHNTSENMDFMGYGSNIGTMKSIGMEISADYTYRKLVLHGNASWLRRSRRVAYAIMDYMQDNGLSRNDVAEKLGVSPQYVSKILSGKVNFSFKTISEIEESLGIEVFQAAAMEA